MRCYSHLSDDEREQIGLAKAVGHSIGAMAKAIGRPKSTISRELSRNKLPSGRYSPLHAAALCYRLGATLAAGAVAIPLEPIPGIDLLYDIGVPIVLIWYWYTFFRDAHRMTSGTSPTGPKRVTHG